MTITLLFVLAAIVVVTMAPALAMVAAHISYR